MNFSLRACISAAATVPEAGVEFDDDEEKKLMISIQFKIERGRETVSNAMTLRNK